MRKRLLLAMFVLALAYSVTWIGGGIMANQDVIHRTELAYQRAQQINQERIAEARQLGIPPGLLISLHKDGPIVNEWCLPLLPGILWRHWEASIGPMSGGGGSSLILFYGFGTTEFCSLGGWRN
jgi:hypothetical protein